MTGRPKLRALVVELEQRTRDYFDGDEDTTTPTVLDYVAARLADGGSLRALADSLAVDVGFTVHAERIERYLVKTFGQGEYDTAITRARTRGAHRLAEDAICIVDEPADTQVEVSRAASRARTRQWQAERQNRAELGNQSGPSVSITIGSLHLEALRAPRVHNLLPTPPIIDADVVTIEPADA